MKKTMLAVVMMGVITMSGCAGQIQYRDKYAILTPNDNLLQEVPTPAPSYTPVEYSKLTCDAKEDYWTGYVSQLFGVIAQDNADKAGLRTWKAGVAKQVEDLNKKAQKDGSASQ